MKKLIAGILLLLAVNSYASQRAITDTGEEVILNSDGTWAYSGNQEKPANKIETNKKKFKRPKESSFLLKSTRNSAAFWINTNKWSFKKPKANSEAEYEFQLIGEDLYGMSISEGIDIPVESLLEIALENARSVAPDAKIVKQEYRNVNGNKLIYAEITGTIQGIKFAYLSYYHSNPSGSTQLVTWTSQNLVSKYRPEIQKLLNGFVTQ